MSSLVGTLRCRDLGLLGKPTGKGADRRMDVKNVVLINVFTSHDCDLLEGALGLVHIPELSAKHIPGFLILIKSLERVQRDPSEVPAAKLQHGLIVPDFGFLCFLRLDLLAHLSIFWNWIWLALYQSVLFRNCSVC